MERFEQHQPKSLLELSELEIDQLSPVELAELTQLVILESKEAVSSLCQEILEMDERNFSLDAFYELQELLDEYDELIKTLKIEDGALLSLIKNARQILLEKNPISEIAQDNYILVHSSDLISLRNLLTSRNETAEVCATASSLRKKNDIFRSKTKSIEAGFIYNPQQAVAWFSKDVGSHTSRGKRVLEKRFQEFATASLDEALEKQSGPRVEAWLDGAKAKPGAVLIIENKE